MIISCAWVQSLSLAKIIKEGNFQIDVRKAVTAIDQIKNIENLRHHIESITSNEEFRQLLKKALQHVLDDHSREVNTFYPNMDNLKNIDTKLY